MTGTRHYPIYLYQVCEVKAEMTLNDGDVVLSEGGGFRTEELAEKAAEKYGFVGDNYFIKEVTVKYPRNPDRN
jgi:hypothetical protein